MLTRLFAGIVEGDVFWVFKVQEFQPRFNEICSALLSNPTIIETTNLKINPKPGWEWNGSVFTNPNKESESYFSEKPFLRFAGVVNNKVEFNFIYSIDTINVLRLTLGLRSNPIFIEITDLSIKPDFGWTWNGSEFVEPYIGS